MAAAVVNLLFGSQKNIVQRTDMSLEATHRSAAALEGQPSTQAGKTVLGRPEISKLGVSSSGC